MITLKERVRALVKHLCERHGEPDFDRKLKLAMTCYKNATYYGILDVKHIDRFIEIGFINPILGESYPLLGKLNEELTSYSPDEVLQIEFLESEFNMEPVEAINL